MKRIADFLQSARFELRRRLGLTGSAGIVGLGIAVAVYCYVVPQWQREAQAFQHSRLLLEVSLPKNVAKQTVALQSSSQLDRFAQRFPKVSHNATDLSTVAEQAQKASISLEHGDYQVGVADNFGFVDYEILFPVETDYAHLRSFIAGVLNAAPHATLAALRVERPAANNELLKAQVHFTFVYRGE